MGGRGAGGGGKGGGGGGGSSEATNIANRRKLNSKENALAGVYDQLGSRTVTGPLRNDLIKMGLRLTKEIKALRKTLGASVTPGL